MGGVIGVITHKQTAYASHQCSNTLPPLEHSYFQAAAFFPIQQDRCRSVGVLKSLTCPADALAPKSSDIPAWCVTLSSVVLLHVRALCTGWNSCWATGPEMCCTLFPRETSIYWIRATENSNQIKPAVMLEMFPKSRLQSAVLSGPWKTIWQCGLICLILQ